ncbi:MAG: exosome complex protein Rrp4, partial [Thermoplasmata archaeon]|nr:exosome complex protein Rrp4 [Thermoplasmata archaeon]
MEGQRRDIIVPGTVLGGRNDRLKAGDGTFRRDGEVVANIVGLANPRGEFMNLIPLAGRYIPRSDKKDLVIGIVVETAQSYWNVDINAPTTAMLHVNDTPWKVDFGETVRYLNIGDAVIARVSEVGPLNRTMISIKDKGLRKIENGHIITILASKVPRVIGKKGSMLNLLKARTDCRIFVGQNGRVWV